MDVGMRPKYTIATSATTRSRNRCREVDRAVRHIGGLLADVRCAAMRYNAHRLDLFDGALPLDRLRRSEFQVHRGTAGTACHDQTFWMAV